MKEELRRSFMLAGYDTSPYEKWVAEQSVPTVEGYSVFDLTAVDVAPWEWLGGNGALVHLHGTSGTNNAYVAEIPPGGALTPQRHLYEMFIYVLSGRGATAVWNDPAHKHQFEWQAGSLFAIPLNAAYQFFNTSGTEPVRFYAVTTLPLMLDLMHSREFVFNNPWEFTDRFGGDLDYFSRQGQQYPGRIWETNFVPDVHRFELEDWSVRGAGGRNIFFELADSTMCASISEFPVGTYKKAHRHGPGAHVIILSGQGYSLMWKDEGQPVVKVPWQAGSVFVPPDMWFHQHFNTGPQVARYMPIRWGSAKYHMFNYLGITKDVKEGGDQIEYEDEDPEIGRSFAEALAANGVESRMPEFSGAQAR